MKIHSIISSSVPILPYRHAKKALLSICPNDSTSRHESIEQNRTRSSCRRGVWRWNAILNRVQGVGGDCFVERMGYWLSFVKLVSFDARLCRSHDIVLLELDGDWEHNYLNSVELYSWEHLLNLDELLILHIKLIHLGLQTIRLWYYNISWCHVLKLTCTYYVLCCN